MAFLLRFSSRAKADLENLSANPALEKRAKAVRGCIAKLEANPRHPGLHTHKYDELSSEIGEVVFEAYAENNTPGAYRIFWYYGPEKNMISIIAITRHP